MFRMQNYPWGILVNWGVYRNNISTVSEYALRYTFHLPYTIYNSDCYNLVTLYMNATHRETMRHMQRW